MRAAAIIPAAGRGERLRSARPKALAPLLDRPLLAWTLRPILQCGVFSEIIVACPPDERGSFSALVDDADTAQTPVRLIAGGGTRQESVLRSLREVPAECDLVAIHDGARPLLTPQTILDVMSRAKETGAAIAAVPCKDTVKLCDGSGVVSETLERSRAWLVQTPQCFRRDLIVSAHEKAQREGYTATDDAALAERAGAAVHVVMGSYENIKVTTPEDIMICEQILKRRES